MKRFAIVLATAWLALVALFLLRVALQPSIIRGTLPAWLVVAATWLALLASAAFATRVLSPGRGFWLLRTALVALTAYGFQFLLNRAMAWVPFPREAAVSLLGFGIQFAVLAAGIACFALIAGRLLPLDPNELRPI